MNPEIGFDLLERQRQLDEDQRRIEAIRARCELNQRALQAAVNLYVAVITAPWRALAEDLRNR